MRTKDLFAAAEPFMSDDGTVDYLVTMIKSYESQLGHHVRAMKARMTALEKVIQGDDGFSYMMQSQNGDAGSAIDVIQGQIFELACALQVVLKNSHGIEVED